MNLFWGLHETTIKKMFSEPALSAQICVFFFFCEGFSSKRQIWLFSTLFFVSENTIKPVVSGTRAQKKRGHANFGTFLLVFFDRFWASLVSTLLEVS